MTRTKYLLPLIVAAAWAAPAQAQVAPRGVLGCAVREMPAEARANLRALYAGNGIAVRAEQLIPRPVVDRIEGCLPAGAPDREQRIGQLVAGLMSYEMMNAALGSLASRHNVQAATVQAAWPRLSADDRLALLPASQRPPGAPSIDRAAAAAGARDVAVRFATYIRPGFSAGDAGAPANGAFLLDVVVYTVGRAIVENMAGRD